MIVRIMGEGQFELPEESVESLNALDATVERAIGGGDDIAFREALATLLARVRELGHPLPADALAPSDVVLPGSDAHVAEVREMLGDEGLIPG